MLSTGVQTQWTHPDGNTISSFGIENGIVKYVAEFEEQKENLSNIIGTSFRINIISAFFVSLVILAFKNQISKCEGFPYKLKMVGLIYSDLR